MRTLLTKSVISWEQNSFLEKKFIHNIRLSKKKFVSNMIVTTEELKCFFQTQFNKANNHFYNSAKVSHMLRLILDKFFITCIAVEYFDVGWYHVDSSFVLLILLSLPSWTVCYACTCLCSSSVLICFSTLWLEDIMLLVLLYC